jgi:membrane protease YdiL (CAAX protease family)
MGIRGDHFYVDSSQRFVPAYDLDRQTARRLASPQNRASQEWYSRMNTPPDEAGAPSSPASLVQTRGDNHVRFPWRYAAALITACVIAAPLVLPYDIELMRRNAKPEGTLVWKPAEFAVYVEGKGLPHVWGPIDVVAEVVTTSVVSFLAILLGLKLGQPLGLGWPPIAGFDSGPRRFRRTGSTLLLAVVLGIASVIALGTALVTLHWVLSQFLPSGIGDEANQFVEPPWWAGILVSIAAGVREEVWLRLGVMTTIVWVLTKLTHQRDPRPATIWSGIIFASLLFGLMHLPKASGLVALTAPLIVYVLLGNGVVSLFFGWLYWRKGLIAAMTAHFTQDIITHVVRPLIGA